MASCLARGGKWVGVRGLVTAGRLCENCAGPQPAPAWADVSGESLLEV